MECCVRPKGRHFPPPPSPLSPSLWISSHCVCICLCLLFSQFCGRWIWAMGHPLVPCGLSYSMNGPYMASVRQIGDANWGSVGVVGRMMMVCMGRLGRLIAN
ncbi:uncharacterized protein BO88DRAFT_236822 [Aspergillus vadensis CBS 113365]|uniref:Uncharacterized protein n=1 Tax=Aspergillus vadensis (strain CBS 113365 / IMI 142717 / IBT 24658) TaxID=1448311 RepID=A0A319C8E0_ASPVC|nr:hypothetical protein BO88DRAFT_236822 [Aspergillus vadensis CBS 113365]PYH71618.1 hypothetical protein BO88DRAFT_236822 [Aspergillus vadensis CBS 113365]